MSRTWERVLQNSFYMLYPSLLYFAESFLVSLCSQRTCNATTQAQILLNMDELSISLTAELMSSEAALRRPSEIWVNRISNIIVHANHTTDMVDRDCIKKKQKTNTAVLLLSVFTPLISAYWPKFYACTNERTPFCFQHCFFQSSLNHFGSALFWKLLYVLSRRDDSLWA